MPRLRWLDYNMLLAALTVRYIETACVKRGMRLRLNRARIATRLGNRVSYSDGMFRRPMIQHFIEE